MKKKLLSTIACLALVVFAGVSLAACGTTTTDAIRLYSAAAQDEKCTLKNVEFDNDESLTITEKDKTFTVTGKASFMSDEQSTAYWGDTSLSDEAYIIIELDLPAESTIAYQVYASEGDGITQETDDEGKTINIKTVSNVSTETVTAEDDTLWIVVLLTGDYVSVTDNIRTFTVTTGVGSDSETSVVYTLDTSAVVVEKDA